MSEQQEAQVKSKKIGIINHITIFSSCLYSKTEKVQLKIKLLTQVSSSNASTSLVVKKAT